MGQQTKIDWCDASWNPVTGCKRGCEYCYAERIAERFRGCDGDANPGTRRCIQVGPCLYELDDWQIRRQKDGRPVTAAYPYGFSPTLHRYRLDEPRHWARPRNIFVCSMADLFGEWVPETWIEQVFDACRKAPQHRYLFLTKNPARLLRLAEAGKLPVGDGYWYGTTCVTQDKQYFYSDRHNTFLSIEPLQGDFDPDTDVKVNWVITGAETGNRREKVIPQRAWVNHICEACDRKHIPVFMKHSLLTLMSGVLRQEYPWKEGTAHE